MPNPNIVATKAISLKQALWLAKGHLAYDALAYDKVSPSPAKQVDPMAVKADAKIDLPSFDRVLVRSYRQGDDERPRDAKDMPMGKDERPIINVYKDVPNETGGRLKLRGNRESLASDHKPKPPRSGNPPVGSNISVQTKHLRYMFTHGKEGEPHPELNRRDWLKANSYKNLMLPTGANDICTKCGLTDCHCKDKPHDPKTCTCLYHVKLREQAIQPTTATSAVTIQPRYAKGYQP